MVADCMEKKNILWNVDLSLWAESRIMLCSMLYIFKSFSSPLLSDEELKYEKSFGSEVLIQMEMGTLQWIYEELKCWEWEPCSYKEKFYISDAVENFHWMVADCMEKKKHIIKYRSESVGRERNHVVFFAWYL